MIDALAPALADLDAALLDAIGAVPRMTVLDLACGPGQTSAAAAARGCVPIGIDLEAEMVATARARHPGLEFQIGDMLSPPAGPWDAATCRMGGHHVDAAWIQAVHATLRPGGRLAIAEMDGHEDRSDQGMHAADHWIDLFEAAGFQGVEATPVATRFTAVAKDAGIDLDETPLRDGAAFVVVGTKA